MNKFLVVGIGNIGPEYAGTRHNIGFDIADAFVNEHDGSFAPGRLGSIAEIKWKGKIIICMKPSTFVNLSGQAVKYWLEKEKIAIENLLVLVDDIALPLSRLRLRPAGSDAGHNGLKSIQDALGTDSYPKLRFGIGHDFRKGEQVEYVLGRWTESELPLVRNKVGKCVEIVENFVFTGIARTMSQYNKLEITL